MLFRFYYRIAELEIFYISATGGTAASPLRLKSSRASAGIPRPGSGVVVLILVVKIRFFHVL